VADGKIKVGVVGAGAVARLAHLPGYAADPRVEIVGVVDTAQHRAEALAEMFGSQAYPSIAALLSEGGAQAVSICVPNSVHAPLALEALRGGADVLIEKPMALEPSEATEIAATARSDGRVLMVGMTHRFTNRATVLARYLDAGRFGRIYHARAVWMRRRGDPGGWFTDKKYSGGGAMMDIGVHALDLAWWLMGRPEPVRVTGSLHREIAPYETEFVGAWPTADRPAEAVFDVDDFMAAHIQFENGASLEISVAWAVNGPDGSLDLDLYGTKGGARLNPLTVYTEEEGVVTNSTPLVPSDGDTWTDEVRHFVDVVESRAEPLITGEQGVQVVRMLHAISQSAEQGRQVDLEAEG